MVGCSHMSVCSVEYNSGCMCVVHATRCLLLRTSSHGVKLWGETDICFVLFCILQQSQAEGQSGEESFPTGDFGKPDIVTSVGEGAGGVRGGGALKVRETTVVRWVWMTSVHD